MNLRTVSSAFLVRLPMLALCVSWGLGSTAFAADMAAKPGDKTVADVCSMCHGTGLMGSPKIGDGAAWQGRLKTAGSVDALVASAAHGKGNMPPRGAHPELTDADLKAAIEFMLSKSGG